MGYFIITAKHHDGFAMFDSNVSDYNVVKATPWKRDPMRELRDACKKHGVHFGFYYSHAWDWEARRRARATTGATRTPAASAALDGRQQWSDEHPAEAATASRSYVDGKAIPQIRS